MNTPLNNDTQQKARDLARKITVAHDLDPEIQEELYGHIEDKLLAYKSGEERISDEDAFILVREHFGDAGNVKQLFHDVYGPERERNLFRNILVAAITTLTFVQGIAWFAHFADLIFDDGIPDNLPGRVTASLIAGVVLLLSCLCFWRWKQRMGRGEYVWFQSWKTQTLFVVALALFVTSHVVPGYWAPLLLAIEVPSMLHNILLKAFPPNGPIHFAITPLAFILANAGVFALCVWGATRFKRLNRNPRSRRKFSSLSRATSLYAAMVMMVLLELVVLSFFADFFSRADIPSSWIVSFIETLLILPVRMAAVIAFCASWIWWCDTPPRMTRGAAKAALLWAGFTALYAALPALQVGFAHGEKVWQGSGTVWFKLGIPGTSWWFYTAHFPYDAYYESGRILTMVAFTLFFAVVATHSYRIYDEANNPVTAQE